jgi:hypothetical protein
MDQAFQSSLCLQGFFNLEDILNGEVKLFQPQEQLIGTNQDIYGTGGKALLFGLSLKDFVFQPSHTDKRASSRVILPEVKRPWA